MKLPLSWIREFVSTQLSPGDLAHRLTMAGAEVEEFAVVGQDWERVLIGRVASLERHPSLAQLWVAHVDLGDQTATLATTATNLRVGDLVPLGLPGGRVGSTRIEARDFDGVVSEGMLLSADELGIGHDREGIYVLEPGPPPGQPLRDYLDEVVLDLKITPNRADQMSVVGVAREVAALTGQPLRRPVLESLEGEPPAAELASVIVEAPDLCLRYNAAVVLGVSVGQSPAWMQRRLHFSGMRPINNIVDVTNYVMLEMGQPLHGFDRRLLADGLFIRRARAGERIVTLDGQERELSTEMLVIADAERVQAIAGVMGGLASEVGERTREVVIESANFEPRNIRRTARALRMSTEASRRFERGLDPGQPPSAAQRAANLMAQLAGGTAAAGVVDAYPTRLAERRIFVTPERIAALLGKRYSPEEIQSVLTTLEFQVERRDGGLEVVPPGHRRDVEGPQDLAEEVARITGYEAIPETLPAGRLPEPRPNPIRESEQRARRVLVGCGLQEVITYSLVDPGTSGRLDAAVDADSRLASAGPDGEGETHDTGAAAPVRMANPMSAEQSMLRTTLLASLLDTLRANRRHTERVAIFELARVYLPPLQPLPEEVRRLAIAMSGPRQPHSWSRAPGDLDFFDLKGVVETLLRALGIDHARFRAAEHPTFHPGRVAQVVLEAGSVLGTLGEVHPRVAARFDLERGAVLAAELDFEALAQHARDVDQLEPLPRFPGVVVDLAVQVDERVTHEQVLTVVTSAGGELLERVELFDVYRGAPLPSGTKSLAYSLTFRSSDRTLRDEEAAEAQAGIERELARRLSAVIRGRTDLTP